MIHIVVEVISRFEIDLLVCGVPTTSCYRSVFNIPVGTSVTSWIQVSFYRFCGGDIFVMQIMFYVDMLNTKVVDNFLILLFLKFHDFRPNGLLVIDFRSCCQVFACPLDRSE